LHPEFTASGGHPVDFTKRAGDRQACHRYTDDEVRKGDAELRFFSTITSFGTPHDVTLEELRIECSFTTDEATATATACSERFAS
jgi:hypothetical protein